MGSLGAAWVVQLTCPARIKQHFKTLSNDDGLSSICRASADNSPFARFTGSTMGRSCILALQTRAFAFGTAEPWGEFGFGVVVSGNRRVRKWHPCWFALMANFCGEVGGCVEVRRSTGW